MRILVLSARYPSAGNLYANMFVHVRVLRYIARGHTVGVTSFFTDQPRYEFEGVPVQSAPDIHALTSMIDAFAPDVVVIHFFQGWMLRKIIERLTVPVVVWVHAIEAMWWFRRLFNFELSREFADYVKYNTIHMPRLRRLFKYSQRHPSRVRFVFVSEWIRRIAEKDTLSRPASYDVIPNPIDTERFPYSEKDATLRTRVLLIRPFNARKYANDIALDAIRRLGAFAEFDEFQFSIHGSGRLFDRLTRPLRDLKNVNVCEGFLTHSEIRELHATHGVFLCPTRQDSQGVSMCEAMSSGLVPITSMSSAIPEFVTHGATGFLTTGSNGIVAAMRRLYREPRLFAEMSRAAARDIRRKAAADHVVDRELRALQVSVDEFR
jgi:glycosyltransferase involved in cell wall biosynthesis